MRASIGALVWSLVVLAALGPLWGVLLYWFVFN